MQQHASRLASMCLASMSLVSMRCDDRLRGLCTLLFASLLAVMLSVPIKGDAQAVYNVLSVKHLAKTRGGLLVAATSAVPWAILPKTDVRA
jgi:hypothetical protein